MKFTTIKAARDFLISAGYSFSGYGAMTQAEGYKLNGKTVFIRRDRSGYSVR